MLPNMKTVATKMVAVLGGAFRGSCTAYFLSRQLPKNWRVVLIDRNSHFNWLYIFPRYSIVPGHEHKAFIPYTDILDTPSGSKHLFLQAHVKSLQPNLLTLSRSFPEYGIEGPEPTLHFDYAIYALGSHLPAPIDVWGPVGDESEEHKSTLQPPGMKASGIEWLQRWHARIEQVPSILVVGGGALEYATDIAHVFPNKPMTLLHSRTQLLPQFSQGMHDEIISVLSSMNITTILGDRLDLSYPGKTIQNSDGVEECVVRTQSGREIQAGIILLCTGQIPNTNIMQELLAESIMPDGTSKGKIRVKCTMQVAIPAPVKDQEIESALSDSSLNGDKTDEQTNHDDSGLVVPHPNLFAVGDAADAFGAVNNGCNAYFQGSIAAGNIIKLIKLQGHQENVPLKDTNGSHSDVNEDLTLECYTAEPPGIKISLGLKRNIYKVNSVIGNKTGGPVDMDAVEAWKLLGADPESHGMYR